MAQITYQVFQKPVEERIIDAGCVYWNIERAEMMGVKESRKTGVEQKRNILFYLIRYNTNLTNEQIARLFQLKSHSNVSNSISIVDARKHVVRQINDALNSIMHLCSKLDADFVTTDVRLVSRETEINTNGNIYT